MRCSPPNCVIKNGKCAKPNAWLAYNQVVKGIGLDRADKKKGYAKFLREVGGDDAALCYLINGPGSSQERASASRRPATRKAGVLSAPRSSSARPASALRVSAPPRIAARSPVVRRATPVVRTSSHAARTPASSARRSQKSRGAERVALTKASMSRKGGSAMLTLWSPELAAGPDEVLDATVVKKNRTWLVYLDPKRRGSK